MFEYVKDLGLAPARPYAKRKLTDLIVLHHYAADATPEEVHRYHVGRGHRGIDYNVVVMLDGGAVWGRGLAYAGGHVLNGGASRGMNARSVGIACQGNFEKRKMPAAQKATLFRVIRDCLRAYPDIGTILGHKEVKATACPGRNFPLDQAKRLLQTHMNSMSGNDSSFDAAEPPAKEKAGAPKFTLSRLLRLRIPMLRGSDVKDVQRELIARGYSVGACGMDGVFGSDTEKGVKKFQEVNGLEVDGIVGKNTTRAMGGEWKGP